MDGFSWCCVPRMHRSDPGNIEHLYLVTFTLQQLFTPWPPTWSFLWIEPLANAKTGFGLFVPQQPPVSSVMLNLLVFVQQQTSTSSTGLQGEVKTQTRYGSHLWNLQRCHRVGGGVGGYKSAVLKADIYSISHTADIKHNSTSLWCHLVFRFSLMIYKLNEPIQKVGPDLL